MQNRNHWLLIDNDPDDQEIFAIALREVLPHVVLQTANSGAEALAMLEEGVISPGLIFLDLNMPRMNGRECLQRIKSSDRHKDIPVIIYTTSVEKKDKEETEQLGAADFITKPPVIETLSHLLKEAAKRHA